LIPVTPPPGTTLPGPFYLPVPATPANMSIPGALSPSGQPIGPPPTLPELYPPRPAVAVRPPGYTPWTGTQGTQSLQPAPRPTPPWLQAIDATSVGAPQPTSQPLVIPRP